MDSKTTLFNEMNDLLNKSKIVSVCVNSMICSYKKSNKISCVSVFFLDHAEVPMLKLSHGYVL